MIVPDLIIYHWIPTERLTKRYYRKWVIGRGISMGWQIRDRSLVNLKCWAFRDINSVLRFADWEQC